MRYINFRYCEVTCTCPFCTATKIPLGVGWCLVAHRAFLCRLNPLLHRRRHHNHHQEKSLAMNSNGSDQAKGRKDAKGKEKAPSDMKAKVEEQEKTSVTRKLLGNFGRFGNKAKKQGKLGEEKQSKSKVEENIVPPQTDSDGDDTQEAGMVKVAQEAGDQIRGQGDEEEKQDVSADPDVSFWYRAWADIERKAPKSKLVGHLQPI